MAKPDMRKRVDAVDEMVRRTEAGVKGVDKQIEKLSGKWQSLISSQVQINELIDSEEKKRTGVLGAFKKGLGLQIDEERIREANENLAQAIYANDDLAREVAEEKIAALKKQAKLNEEIYDDVEELFPGIKSGIEKAEKAQAAWNRVTEANAYVKLAAIILTIGSLLLMITKRVFAIQEQFGLAKGEAAKVAGQLTLVNMKMKLWGISSEQVASSMEALANTFGEVSPAMVRFAGDMALVARNSGITADNAAEMISLFQAIHGVTKEVALDMITSTKEMAALTGLSPGVILKEMAENADLFASHIGKSEQHLIAAVAQAKKLGMEFGQLTEFGDSLLDITERINKEQMLSAILGRQVNLQRAAMLQAQGDEVGFMNELSNQLQGIGELTAQQRRLFTAELGIATADVMKLAGLQSGMAQKGAQIPGQNPYEQARYKQGERIIKAVNSPQYAT